MVWKRRGAGAEGWRGRGKKKKVFLRASFEEGGARETTFSEHAEGD